MCDSVTVGLGRGTHCSLSCEGGTWIMDACLLPNNSPEKCREQEHGVDVILFRQKYNLRQDWFYQEGLILLCFIENSGYLIDHEGLLGVICLCFVLSHSGVLRATVGKYVSKCKGESFKIQDWIISPKPLIVI